MLVFVRSLEAFEVELLLGPQAGIQVYSTKIYNFIRDSPPGYGSATALGSLFLVGHGGSGPDLSLHDQRPRLHHCDRTRLLQRASAARPATLARHSAFAAPGWWRRCCAHVFLIMGSFMRRYGFFNLTDPFTMQNWERVLRDPAFTASSEELSGHLGVGGRWQHAPVHTGRLLHHPQPRQNCVARGCAYLAAMGGARHFDEPRAPLAFYQQPGSDPSLRLGTGAGPGDRDPDSPVSTQLMKAALLQVGRELEESARISGATWITMYWRILFPLLAPTAFTVALLAFPGALRDISTVVLLYSGASRPLSILLLEYGLSKTWSAADLAIMLVAMIAVVSVVGQRLSRASATPARDSLPLASTSRRRVERIRSGVASVS